MSELKFMPPVTRTTPAKPACPCAGAVIPGRPVPRWVTGRMTTAVGEVPVVSTTITRADRWEHVRCRTSGFRNSYTVQPGLYAVGSPGPASDVLVSANYKLSFDHLRGELAGLDAWILVLDTGGINVWCAAGKGTFGTDELIRRIASVRLDTLVTHRRIILPQLGAPGVSGQAVRKATGFRVHYGPVHARDLRSFIEAGYAATLEMRTVRFGIFDRLILTPMELNPALKKYFPIYALIVLVSFGLQPSGIIFREAWLGGLPFLILGLISITAGAFVTPLLLPFIPSRSFAVKGWLAGMGAVLIVIFATPLMKDSGTFLRLASLLFFPLASSYVALQFTGATTFTGMSGVKKELRIAVPVYFLATGLSSALLALHKLDQWGVL